MAPVLIEVPEDHDNYKSGMLRVLRFLTGGTDWFTVEKQFQQTWRHGTACPGVRAVYKIINTTTSVKKYEQYLYVLVVPTSGIAPIY